MTKLLIAGAIVAVPSVLAAQAPTRRASAKPGADDDVRRVEQEYLDARLRNNKAALQRLIADDYVAVGSSGQIVTRSFAIEAANTTPGGDSLQSMTIDSVEVRRLGSTAVVVGRRNIRTANGPGALRFLHVFEKKNARWQLVASSTTPIQ